MAEIKLTQGKVAMVDDWNLEWLSQYSWSAYKARNMWYAMTGRNTLMHRLVVEKLCGRITGKVDHQNSDGLNNFESNLRIATNSQNAANTGKYNTNTSGFKGVFWYARNRKWHAEIAVNGRRRYLGGFDSKILAAKAYDEAAVAYFGKFAGLNFPNEWSASKVSRFYNPLLQYM
jgi:hypothetical protein